MREIVVTSQFKRDYKKRFRDSGLDTLLSEVIDKLVLGGPVPSKFRDHTLKGSYGGCCECHLKPDLLLIYVRTELELRLIRLGSHSDLFA